MTESAIGISIPVTTAGKVSPMTGRLYGTFMPRAVTGLAILAVWEIVVRLSAPAYVAKPTTVLMAIPRVITDPAFLTPPGDAERGGGGLSRRAGVRHHHRPADGAQPDVRARRSAITSTVSMRCR